MIIKLLSALLLSLLLPIWSSAAEQIPITYVSPELEKLTIYKDITYQFDVDRSQYKWKSSDYAIVTVGGGQFHGIQSGNATITGTPKDPDMEKIKLRVTVPDFTYSNKNIVITSEEGAVFEYTYNRLRGSIDDIKTSGNVFKYEKIKTDRLKTPNQLLLKPIKPGKGKLIFRFSNGTSFTANVTVENSATSTPLPAPTNTPVPSYTEASANKLIKDIAESIYHSDLKSAKYVWDDGYIFIDYKTPRGQTSETIRKTSIKFALSLLRELQRFIESGEIGFNEISFRTYADTVDNYGIIEELEVLSFWIASDEFDATDFDLVSVDNLPGLMKSQYEHGIMNTTPSSSSQESQTSIIYKGRAKRFVNIRENPDANSTRIGAFNEGDEVKIITLNYVPKWHQIVYDNQICYVSANYIELE